MIICSCKRVSHRVVESVIDQGASTVEQVGAACGAGTGCGACREQVHDMLDDAGVGCGATGRACPDCPRALSLAS
ncbi:MAG TPA: (2Fe-2S)-binding protein [Kofleriaceae bacterium]|nr:(2Fe-2S)-binding protein [Kofleriaceae bacterium]